jgi:membrane protein involved in colicin uptake
MESPGVEQPRVVKSTPQDILKKSEGTPTVQTRGTRKLEDMSHGAAASPLAGAVLTDNHEVEAMERQGVKMESMPVRRLQGEAEVVKQGANSERKMHEEATRAKEKADAEARRALIQAEAKAKYKADTKAKAKAEAEAKAKARAEALLEAKTRGRS